MELEIFKTQILPLVVSNVAAVSLASFSFKKVTEAKWDRKMLAGGRKQCKKFFQCNVGPLKREQKILAIKESLIRPIKEFRYSICDTG